MRNLINILSEATRPTATIVKSDLNIGVNPPSYGSPTVTTPNDVTTVPGKVSTNSPVMIQPMDDTSMRHFSNLANSDYDDGLDDDYEAVVNGNPEPVVPENLPSIISTAVSQDNLEFNPDWYMVKNLPGYVSRAIRSIGRQVFSPFTSTPIDQIQVVSTLTNPENEVRMLMAWISNTGEVMDEAELLMTEIMPGYGAKVQVRRVAGFEFMLVKDHAGIYVYGYPANDSKITGSSTPKLR